MEGGGAEAAAPRPKTRDRDPHVMAGGITLPPLPPPPPMQTNPPVSSAEAGVPQGSGGCIQVPAQGFTSMTLLRSFCTPGMESAPLWEGNLWGAAAGVQLVQSE